MITYQDIFERNKKWVEENKASDADFFNKLGEGQQPDYFFIGCSDSRVPANIVMGMTPGDVFVHRNIANIVSTTDLNVLSVIEFAVKHLQIKHIVVCGHYECGGVKAAMENKDYGILNPWLNEVKHVYHNHRSEIDNIKDEEEKYKKLVELNVMAQATNIMKTSIVQQMWAESEYPMVHGWVFDIHTGLLKDLNIDYKKIKSEISPIYNIFENE